MGGGTILIPVLGIFFGIDQHVAQAVNLISFVPMAAISIAIHLKNGLMEKKGVITIIATGLLSCALGAYVASVIHGDILKRIFGGFLLILSAVQFVSVFKAKN